MSSIQIEELYLDVTYGQIRGKWWGSRQKKPILLVHGWQDNAGSFDTLIPLLPPEFSYLAIDLPGHGFSSHFPKGTFYHHLDFVPLLEEIRLKLKWERMSLIAHSMGAIISFCYASLYPDQVDLVCALDTLKMQHHHPEKTEKMYTWRAKQLIELLRNLKDKSPEYTQEELTERVFNGSMQSVNVDKAKYLIERGTRPSPTNPNKFYFTRDIRVKFLQPFFVEQEVGLAYLKEIQAAYLFIRGDDRIFSEPEKNIRQAVQLFRKCNKRFEFFKARGTHHFHLNEPEIIAGKIGEFLKKHHTQEEQKYDGFKLVSKL